MAKRKDILFSTQPLTATLSGISQPLLTVTSTPTSSAKPPDKPYILLTARVHPSETNASYVMDGLLDFLVSHDPVATALLSTFVFKIVPLLNPDGWYSSEII